MRFKDGLLGVLFLAASTSLWALGPLPGAGSPVNFVVAKHTLVPGEVLKPGTYTIHVVDHIEDRMVVEVDGANGKEHDLFLAVPARTGLVGPVAWQKGTDGATALKGFNFPDGMAVEFVYPKATAVALAKANSAPVVAVDPESEGKPNVPKMSPDDRRIVTLWLLSITTTGPNDKTPAVEAKRYQAPNEQQGVEARYSPQPTAAPPANESASVSRPPMPPARAAYRAPKQKPVISQLPHTASQLPLIALVGLGSMLAGCLLMMRRRFTI
jgi:LPXTG-motif cell wall-anchored protein